MFCIPSQVSAEEERTFDRFINIGVEGSFKDGNRLYGGYLANLEMKHITDNKYKVMFEFELLTINYKTDRYQIEEFAFNFIGTNVKVLKKDKELKILGDKQFIDKEDQCIAETSKGILGYNIDLKKNRDYIYVNNTPIVVVNLEIEVGSTARFGVVVDNMELIGVDLARNTKVENTPFIKLSFDIGSQFLEFSKPYYQYKTMYNNRTLVKDAHYGTWYGPVPSDWKIAGNL